MDLGVTLIGVLTVALCAMPFIITYRSRKKKEKQFLLSLNEIAKQHDCIITQYEVFGNFTIGIDESKNFVFFVLNAQEELKQQQYVDLSTIKTCEITKNHRLTSKKEKVIDRLSLNLDFVDKSKPNVILDFYNSDVSYQLNGEIQLAEKWNKLINTMLSSKK